MALNGIDTLYVIADGQKASFYTRCEESGEEPRLKHLESRTPQELLDDGPSGKTPPESSLQDLDEATFAKQLGHYLNRQKYRAAFKSMVLVADPVTLGQLRSVLDTQTRDSVIEEHNKTLTTATLEDIHRSLF